MNASTRGPIVTRADDFDQHVAKSRNALNVVGQVGVPVECGQLAVQVDRLLGTGTPRPAAPLWLLNEQSRSASAGADVRNLDLPVCSVR